MSRENVELVRMLQPSPDVDLVALFRDEEGASRLLSSLGPYVHEGFVAEGFRLEESEHTGLAGLRAGWSDWLEPWESYRVEIEDVIDAGDEAVVVVTRDYGRRAGMEAEVLILGAAIWIVRDGKILRATFYADRDAAFEAAGLSR
jgi:hypothetical protein